MVRIGDGSVTAISVFLADDHPLILEGVHSLLAAAPGIAVVGEAANGRTALSRIEALRPQVAVLDLSMPGLNGMEVIQAAARTCPSCRCIMLSVHEERPYVRRVMDAGARGYLLKRSTRVELVRAIHAVARGETFIDSAVAGYFVGGAGPSGLALPDADGLSEREADVLRFTAMGYGNKAIAAAMGISGKTVESHKARGMEKLGFTDRVALVRYAVGQGWLGPGAS
ncbi:response regulator transcription factor [Paracraurococcus ruber]|uniref:response regulator transcription factor n=1 Tax=Paracraurococcus ruber TaxID=77675 RepID=UPI001A9261D5|nr:response regulator transcription factor [Paracraurococcus ruber]